MSDFKELKEIAYKANMMLPENRVVIFTFGNVSAFDKENRVFAIKPSGVVYSDLKAEDMVIVDLSYNVIEGRLNPSSDTKTHAVLYQHFPNIGGICHTHSTFAVAWSQAMRSIPVYGTTHADHLSADIPCTKVMADEMIRGDYEEATGFQIVEAFKNISYEEIQMVLVACHGPFTWGATAEKAVYNSVILEELARMAMLTEQIDSDTPRMKSTLIDKHYLRKHGKDAYYGQV